MKHAKRMLQTGAALAMAAVMAAGIPLASAASGPQAAPAAVGIRASGPAAGRPGELSSLYEKHRHRKLGGWNRPDPDGDCGGIRSGR